MRDKQGLTPKQAEFVRQYLIDLNGTQAAIRAGYSPRTANEQAVDLLAKPSIASAVSIAKDKRGAKVGIKAENVLRQIAWMTFGDPSLFADENDVPIPLSKLPPEAKAMIQAIEWAKDGSVRYKICDRNSAAEKLMKHLGLYEKDNGQKGDAVADLLAAIHSAGSRLAVTNGRT